MTRIAFFAPMKPPDHPTPSGDRRMARLFMDAMRHAGYTPEIASTLRLRDGAGDDAAQAVLMNRAAEEIERLASAWRDDPPALWFTYHCYYKAPDLIGPAIADRLGIPYVIAEASRARKRLTGPWAGFARAAEAAVDRADLLLAMTAHDRFALDRDAKDDQEVVDFPPFIDPGSNPAPKRPGAVLRLLTVAMMREGDKRASYVALANALHRLDAPDWHLTVIGDGPGRTTVEALFTEFGARVSFVGAIGDLADLRRHYEKADMLLWPGVNEAYGMVYLEAQAAGTPVVAEDWPGPCSVVAPASALVPRGDPARYAAAIRAMPADAGRGARAHVLHHHAIATAAERLAHLFGDLT